MIGVKAYYRHSRLRVSVKRSAAVETALRRADLLNQADDLALADLIMRGKRRTDGSDAYLLVEVSWGVGPYDVERAARRAELLTHLGMPVIPAVAGRRLTAEAVELARAKQVWQVLNGSSVAPTNES